jgi:hypothetical protein
VNTEAPFITDVVLVCLLVVLATISFPAALVLAIIAYLAHRVTHP